MMYHHHKLLDVVGVTAGMRDYGADFCGSYCCYDLAAGLCMRI